MGRIASALLIWSLTLGANPVWAEDTITDALERIKRQCPADPQVQPLFSGNKICDPNNVNTRSCDQRYKQFQEIGKWTDCYKVVEQCRKNVDLNNKQILDYNSYVYKCREIANRLNGKSDSAIQKTTTPDTQGDAEKLIETLRNLRKAASENNKTNTSNRLENLNRERTNAANREAEYQRQQMIEYRQEKERERQEEQARLERAQRLRESDARHARSSQSGDNDWVTAEFCPAGMAAIQSCVINTNGCSACEPLTELPGYSQGGYNCGTEAGLRAAVQFCASVCDLDQYRRSNGCN